VGAVRTFSSFVLASRGLWSLGIFVVSNYKEIYDFFKNKEKVELERQINRDLAKNGIVAANSGAYKEEEHIQLNVALQKEIVLFTALGIRKAVRRIDSITQKNIAVISEVEFGEGFYFFVRLAGFLPFPCIFCSILTSLFVAVVRVCVCVCVCVFFIRKIPYLVTYCPSF
jgi:hypothetical protein